MHLEYTDIFYYIHYNYIKIDGSIEMEMEKEVR